MVESNEFTRRPLDWLTLASKFVSQSVPDCLKPSSSVNWKKGDELDLPTWCFVSITTLTIVISKSSFDHLVDSGGRIHTEPDWKTGIVRLDQEWLVEPGQCFIFKKIYIFEKEKELLPLNVNRHDDNKRAKVQEDENKSWWKTLRKSSWIFSMRDYRSFGVAKLSSISHQGHLREFLWRKCNLIPWGKDKRMDWHLDLLSSW